MLKNIISRVNVICGNRAALKCLFAVLLITTGVGTASAYDFKTGGLCYNILSKQDKTVEVTYYYHNGNTYNGYEMSKLDAEELLGYVGDEVIPEKVNFDGNEYTVVAIGEYAFRDCYVTSMELPTTVTEIGDGAFLDYSSSLTSVDMPSVTEIGGGAFMFCRSLTSVDMPSVTEIGDGAFLDCSRLSSVDIPSSVATIGALAFGGCSSLEAVYCHWDEPLVCYPEFADEVLDRATLYVPAGTKSAYEAVAPWSGFKNIVEKNYSSITFTQSSTPTVTVIDGAIVVEDSDSGAAQPVEVYSTGGQCVHRGTGTRIEGLPQGVYVIKVGESTQKVVL